MVASIRSVSEIMQHEVVTLCPEDHLDLAEDVMKLGRIRHMPVLEGRRVVGVVSERDLLAASLTRSLEFEAAQRRGFLRSVLVSEVMSREVATVAPEVRLEEAARLLIERRVGCLPVVDAHGDLVGLVTETDLLSASLLSEPPAGEIEVEAEKGTVEEWRDWIDTELVSLRRTRDELRLKLHLAEADARDRWEELERGFHELESRRRQLVRAAEGPAHDVADAARLLAGELREGYRRIRAAI